MNDLPITVRYDYLADKKPFSIMRMCPKKAQSQRPLQALGYPCRRKYDYVDVRVVNGEFALRAPLEARTNSCVVNKSHKKRLSRSECQVLLGAATLRGRRSVPERFDGLVDHESEVLELE